mgnify:CR=1 FL=1
MSRRHKPNNSRQASPNGSPSTDAGKGQRKWYKTDLHLHTPASHDYEIPQVSYLDWMRKGQVFPGRELKLLIDTETMTVADAQLGFGQWTGRQAVALHGL